MGTVRVEIDLNSRDHDGLTRVRLSRAGTDLHPGQIVTAYESEDGVAALAMVHSVNPARDYAQLMVNWESLADDRPDYTPTVFPESNRARAVVANAAAQRSSSNTAAAVAGMQWR